MHPLPTPLRRLLVGASSVALAGSAALAVVPSSASPPAPDAGPVEASAGTAADPPGRKARKNTAIRFLSFSKTARYKGSFEIRGQLVVTGPNQAAANRRVTLLKRSNGGQRWKRLKANRTSRGDSPRFRFRVPALGNADYRVAFRGGSRLQPSRNAVTTRTFRKVTSRVRDGSGKMRGHVAPNYRNRKVSLQRAKCRGCNYQRVKRTRTGDKGVYGFQLRAPRQGRSFYRAVVPANQRFIRSFGATFATSSR